MSGIAENRLITIPFSHYCEKARWALEYCGVPFREEGHVPLFHWRASYGAGGRRTVPVLVTTSGDGVLADSTDILKYADRMASPERKLYSSSSEVDELEELFDAKLGPATRRLAYYHLLPYRSAMVPVLRQHVPRVEAALISPLYPLAAMILKRGLKIDIVGAQRSLERTRTIFDTVGERLKDGRNYLVGDRLSAADLTFAALSAPVLLPSAHPFSSVDLASLPEGMRSLVEDLRSTPAGKFALALYAKNRRR